MGHIPFSIRSLVQSQHRWRRTGLASVVLLVLTANALPQEKTRIVVVYGDNPPSAVVDAVFQAKSQDLPGIIEELDLRLDSIGNVIFVSDKESPYVEKARQTSRLLSALPVGRQVDVSSLDAETRTALSSLTDHYFALSEQSHVPESMIVSAQAVYKIKVNGKETRMSLTIRTTEEGRPRLNGLLEKPTSTSPTTRGANQAVVHENHLRLVVRAPRHNPETLAAISEYFKKLAEEEELVRQELKRVIDPLIRNLEQLNANTFTSGMPNGKQSLDQLPPEVRNRLHDSFIGSFSAYGYSSADEAEIAWYSAELADSGVEFMLFYATSSESSEPMLRAVAITMSGK